MCHGECVRLTFEANLDQLPAKAEKVGRMLRYRGGAAKQLGQSAPLEQLLLDVSSQPVSMYGIGTAGERVRPLADVWKQP